MPVLPEPVATVLVVELGTSVLFGFNGAHAGPGFVAPLAINPGLTLIIFNKVFALVLPENAPLPLKTAETGWFPLGRELGSKTNVAVPAATATGEPTLLPFTLNWTVPPSGSGDTLAVKFTDVDPLH